MKSYAQVMSEFLATPEHQKRMQQVDAEMYWYNYHIAPDLDDIVSALNSLQKVITIYNEDRLAREAFISQAQEKDEIH